MSRTGQLTYLLKPALEAGKALGGSDVIDDDDAVCAAVVGGRHRTEPLLA